MFTYHLAAKAEEEIIVEIIDSQGEVIRTMSSVAKPRPQDDSHPDVREGSKNEPELTAKAGLNRASWDIRLDGADEIPDAVIDIGAPRYGPLALPGDYEIRLIVDDETFTQPLQVTADPRKELDLDAAREHLEFQIQVRDQMTEIARMVETIRAVRDQIGARDRLLKDKEGTEALIEAGQGLVAKLDAVEEKIHNPHAEVSYDILGGRHGGAQLYSRLSWLFEGAREHDGPPTQGMLEVHAEMSEELDMQRQALEEALGAGLEQMNRLSSEKGLGSVITR